MRTLALLFTLALALAIGCSKNQAGNANSSSGSNPSADNTTATPDNSAASPSSSSAKLSDSEKQLLQKVAEADKAEIEMGQLAQSNAASPKVKDFGQKLVDDHTQNSQQLQQIAQQKGVQLEDQEKPDEQSAKS
jgi:putative membrane protein